MSFEQLSYLAQIVASVALVASLLFVAFQIKQNTGALQRNEHNSTMAQWTVIRMAIAGNRDIAELVTAGLHGLIGRAIKRYQLHSATGIKSKGQIVAITFDRR